MTAHPAVHTPAPFLNVFAVLVRLLFPDTAIPRPTPMGFRGTYPPRHQIPPRGVNPLIPTLCALLETTRSPTARNQHRRSGPAVAMGPSHVCARACGPNVQAQQNHASLLDLDRGALMGRPAHLAVNTVEGCQPTAPCALRFARDGPHYKESARPLKLCCCDGPFACMRTCM